MKFIAIRDFRNHDPKNIKVEGPVLHPNHIHKGAFIEISTAKELNDMSNAERETVAKLGAACCIADASNEKLVKQIRQEADETAGSAKRALETAKAAK